MLKTTNRRIVAAMTLSAIGLVGIVTHEGYSEKAIIPVPGDVPTIGFGSTEGVKMGDKITPPVALGRAMSDINKFEGAVKKCVKVPLYQHEYDAFVSFSYNVGQDAFCKSTLVKKLNSGDYEGACNELRKWVFVGDKKIQGLIKRRSVESDKCLNGGVNADM